MKKTDKITLGFNYQIFKRSVPHHDKLQNTIAKEVAKSPHNAVIDLGCGLGYTTEAVLKFSKPKHLYLVDYDKRMIEFVSQNKKIIDKKSINITISNEDILSFLDKIKSNSIDCIYSCWVIHNLKKTERAKIIKEVCRVLKKGGCFINGDKYSEMNEKNHKASFKWQESEYQKAIIKYPKDNAVYKGWISHHYEDDKNRFTEKEQNNLSKLAGFNTYKFGERFHLESVFKAKK
jgi:ubiquinone/menaquinone biosynthesis C-methylase UbiE